MPIKLDVTDFLSGAGPQVIVVRAEDPPEDRYQPRGKQYWQPQSRGIFYTRTTGIWQPVWLEAAGAKSSRASCGRTRSPMGTLCST